VTGPKPVTLALQGGGAHGAFTWGVLDRLLADDRLYIEGISGTSAGAMNGAMVAEGLMCNGGPESARSELERFWREIARMGRFAPFVRTPLDAWIDPWNLDASPGYVLFDAISRYLSPYQFNPLNVNPLQDLLADVVDFERVRACDRMALYVSATNVRTGKIRVFDKTELTPEVVMASAALPHVFQAVEVDGEPYWDGGYMGNPAIFPLIYGCDTPDVVLVQVNPVQRETTPTTMPEINDRLNEITFNATLMREMRAIAFVTELVDAGRLDPGRYKRLYMHRVDVPSEMRSLTASSKFNAEWDFIAYLRDLGRRQASEWIEANIDAIGVQSTVNIESDYL
jgi:NTE family protein